MVFLLTKKELIKTVNTDIYVGEANINNIIFVIPKEDGNVDFSTVKTYIEINAPHGSGYDMNTFPKEFDETPYKEGYYSITIRVDEWMTRQAGRVILRLIFTQTVEATGEETVVLKTRTSGFDVYKLSEKPSSSSGGNSSDSEYNPIVYTVVQDDTTNVDGAAESLNVTFNNGDVIVIKDSNGIASGYQYSEDDWVTFTGNVSADNVILSEDILCAGNYTTVGNITKTSSGTTTISAIGKSLSSLLQTIFTKELQPTASQPSASISFPQAGTYEVGRTISPTYSVSFNPGSYTYGPATGVTVTSWEISDNATHTSDTVSGSFDSFLVTDSTSYKIIAVAIHTEGVDAYTNLNNIASPRVYIASGTKTATSGTVSGYRPWFYGILATSSSEQALTSDIIRGLTNGGNYNGGKTVTVSVNGQAAKRIIVAIPGNTKRGGVTKVMKTDGLSTDITSTYTLQSDKVSVDDYRKNGNNPIDYKIWVYEPAAIDSGEIHQITLG